MEEMYLEAVRPEGPCRLWKFEACPLKRRCKCILKKFATSADLLDNWAAKHNMAFIQSDFTMAHTCRQAQHTEVFQL